MITLSIDAMGGDFGLDVTVPAAIRFLSRNPDARLIMVGQEDLLQQALNQAKAPMDRIEVLHASEIVGMDEAPQLALKNKKDSSMRVAINQVKEGKAQAAVSAGNTGALMATARFVLKTLPHIERPAIAKFLPTHKQACLMLDLGANVDCTPAQLQQFAILGNELVSALNPDQPAPKVALLNIGNEEIKGTDTVKQTFALLKNTELNFIGNIEGDRIFDGDVDVIVADGFVGNIMLKTIEGTAKFVSNGIKNAFARNLLTKLGAIASLPALSDFKKHFDPRRYNGAIFLGLRGIVVKSHGGTDATGFAFALEEAYQEARADVIARIEAGVSNKMAQLNNAEEN